MKTNNIQDGIFSDTTPGQDVPQITSMMNESGEINPHAFLKFDERLLAFRKLFPHDKYNVVLLSQFIMGKVPHGVTLFPQLIECTDDDLWTEENTKNENGKGLSLPRGHVEPSARFISKIGMAAGVQLKKVVDHQIDVDGVPYLEIQYIASIRLPDGTVISSQPTGKAQPLKTNSGYTQAHIRENTDIKARRNAIKEILAVPTSMPIAQAKRYWVTAKVIYDKSNPESAEILKEISNESEKSISLLYGNQEKKEPSQSITEIITIIKETKNIDQLQNVWNSMNKSEFSEFELNALKGYYLDQSSKIKSGVR